MPRSTGQNAKEGSDGWALTTRPNYTLRGLLRFPPRAQLDDRTLVGLGFSNQARDCVPT
jgi:hypothetical protein